MHKIKNIFVGFLLLLPILIFIGSYINSFRSGIKDSYSFSYVNKSDYFLVNCINLRQAPSYNSSGANYSNIGLGTFSTSENSFPFYVTTGVIGNTNMSSIGYSPYIQARGIGFKYAIDTLRFPLSVRDGFYYIVMLTTGTSYRNDTSTNSWIGQKIYDNPMPFDVNSSQSRAFRLGYSNFSGDITWLFPSSSNDYRYVIFRATSEMKDLILRSSLQGPVSSNWTFPLGVISLYDFYGGNFVYDSSKNDDYFKDICLFCANSSHYDNSFSSVPVNASVSSFVNFTSSNPLEIPFLEFAEFLNSNSMLGLFGDFGAQVFESLSKMFFDSKVTILSIIVINLIIYFFFVLILLIAFEVLLFFPRFIYSLFNRGYKN